MSIKLSLVLKKLSFWKKINRTTLSFRFLKTASPANFLVHVLTFNFHFLCELRKAKQSPSFIFHGLIRICINKLHPPKSW